MACMRQQMTVRVAFRTPRDSTMYRSRAHQRRSTHYFSACTGIATVSRGDIGPRGSVRVRVRRDLSIANLNLRNPDNHSTFLDAARISKQASFSSTSSFT